MLGYFVFFLMYLLYFLFQLWFLSEIDVFFGWPNHEDWKYFCIFYLHYLFQLWFLSEINVFCGCPYYVDWMYGWSEIGRPACNGGAAAGGGIAPTSTLCYIFWCIFLLVHSGTLRYTLVHPSSQTNPLFYSLKFGYSLQFTLIHRSRRRSYKKLAGTLGYTLVHSFPLLIWYTF